MSVSMNAPQNSYDYMNAALPAYRSTPTQSVFPSAYGNSSVQPLGQTDSVSGKKTNVAEGRTEKAEKKGECQTCKKRKYIDGSNEGNVSFKAPGHIAPEASASIVMAHEKEHVANAIKKGNEPGNELVSATVSLKTAICPECGRSYVAGGTTRTVIKYGKSEYDQNRKAADLDALLGANVDAAV